MEFTALPEAFRSGRGVAYDDEDISRAIDDAHAKRRAELPTHADADCRSRRRRASSGGRWRGGRQRGRCEGVQAEVVEGVGELGSRSCRLAAVVLGREGRGAHEAAPARG